ncbi:MAG: VWA domain-containing protein [Vicinamibacterales bacterium]
MAALLLTLCPPARAQAQSSFDDHVLSPQFTEWLQAVAAHTPGEIDEHARNISAWSEARLENALSELESLNRALRKAAERGRSLRPRGTRPDGQLLSAPDTLALLELRQDEAGRGGNLSRVTRRGTLLHSDIAVFLYDRRITAPPAPGDRAGLTILDGQHRGFVVRWPHWEFARDLATRRLQDPADAAAAAQWFVATAAYMYDRGSITDLAPHFREAERHFPALPLLQFYGGLMHAFMGSAAVQQAVRNATLPDNGKPEISSARTHLERAKRHFLKAIDAAPDMAEARVRLGHVLLELQQPQEAVAQLRTALQSGLAPALRYCAELFLGDALAATADVDGAHDAFERAATLFPHAQSAWISLSRLARSRGDHAVATSMLDRVLEHRPPAHTVGDPWWTYYRRDPENPERQLDEWRRTVTAGQGVVMRSIEVAWALALATASVPAGQTPTFSTRADAVEVDVLVTEGGRVVRGLQAGDFEVRDNGELQQVALVTFEQQPLSVMLALDVSDSLDVDRRAHLREAGQHLLDQLAPMDEAGLLTFNHRVTLDAPITAARAEVKAALDLAQGGGRTSLIDATYAALIKAEPGRGRSLVLVFSDGVESSSRLSADAVLDIARHSDVVVYGVSGGPVRGGRFLDQLTRLTGGSFIELASTDTLGETFLQILEEFRRRYVLTYIPRGTPDSGWHKLDVRIRNRRVDVKARPGYSREP